MSTTKLPNKKEFYELIETHLEKNKGIYKLDAKTVNWKILNDLPTDFLTLMKEQRQQKFFVELLETFLVKNKKRFSEFSKVKEEKIIKEKTQREKKQTSNIDNFDYNTIDISGKKLIDSKFDINQFQPLRSGKIIDHFFSDHTEQGGLVNGIYVTIGDPGVGKTTLLADLCLSIERQNPGIESLFINSEMSETDFRYEALKTPILNQLNMIFLSDYEDKEEVNPLTLLEMFVMSNKYKVIVLDSIKDTQDRILHWFISNNQKVSSNYIEKRILSIILKANKEFGTTFLLIQQINKGGDFVGSKGLEHNTTGLFEMRHSKDGRRYIMFKKNRRCGGLVKVPLFYSKDKKTGEMIFDEKDYKARISSKEFSESIDERFNFEADEFDSLLENTNGIAIDFNELGRVVVKTNEEEVVAIS